MSGRVAILGILMTAAVAGVAIYWLQVYAFYDELTADAENVQLTSVVTGVPEPVVFENYKGIDANSSPIRYRACFDLINSQAMLTEAYVIYDGAEPLVAPGWFDCFDAADIGAALERGDAVAFLGVENIQYGIDRVVAVMPDGRAYTWEQINPCGEEVFDGNPAPEGCPPAPPNAN